MFGTALALAIHCTTSEALAQQTIFLEFQPAIQGESTAIGFTNQIDVMNATLAAKNPACTGALTELVSRHYGPRTINISADSIYTGALGGALFARRDLRVPDVTEPTKECATCID